MVRYLYELFGDQGSLAHVDTYVMVEVGCFSFPSSFTFLLRSTLLCQAIFLLRSASNSAFNSVIQNMASFMTSHILRSLQQRPASLAVNLTAGRAPSLFLLAGGFASLPVAASMREMMPTRSVNSQTFARSITTTTTVATAMLDPEMVGFAHSGVMWTATERS